jgi:hypothetical protein
MVERVVRVSRAALMQATKQKKEALVRVCEEKENHEKSERQSIAFHLKKRTVSEPELVAKKSPRSTGSNSAHESEKISIRKSPRITRSSHVLILTESPKTQTSKTLNQRLTAANINSKKSKAEEVKKVKKENENENSVKEEVMANASITNDCLPSTITQRRGRKPKKSESITIEAIPESTVESSTPLLVPNFSPFAEAKRAFHRSGSFKIVGRVEEKAAFSSFWYDSVAIRKGASIYISGNPGTGKTALVDEMLNELKSDDSSVKCIKLNCMMLKDPLKAFNEIASQMEISSREANSFLTMAQLEQKLTCQEDDF